MYVHISLRGNSWCLDYSPKCFETQVFRKEGKNMMNTPDTKESTHILFYSICTSASDYKYFYTVRIYIHTYVHTYVLTNICTEFCRSFNSILIVSIEKLGIATPKNHTLYVDRLLCLVMLTKLH